MVAVMMRRLTDKAFCALSELTLVLMTDMMFLLLRNPSGLQESTLISC
jgi:hypothetical protein